MPSGDGAAAVSAKYVARLLVAALILAGLWRWLQDRRASAQEEGGSLVMGTVARVVAYGVDASAAVEAALEELGRWDTVAARYGPGELARVNEGAGRGPVPVGRALARLVSSALGVSRETEGAFDPTVGAVVAVWDFRHGRTPPDTGRLVQALERVGAQWVVVDTSAGRSTIELARAGMVLDLGGVAKGWAADRAAERAQDAGAWGVLVDAGGDLRIVGRKPGGPWRIGVRHPREEGGILTVLEMKEGAVATSGDYERFFEHGGVRYHHLLVPSTGMPARGCVSVTVVCEEAWRADALATGLFAMGPDRALEFAERRRGIDVLVVDGGFRVRVSAGLRGSVENGFSVAH
jgi:thiamine biosynthesis lipoprotein